MKPLFAEATASCSLEPSPYRSRLLDLSLLPPTSDLLQNPRFSYGILLREETFPLSSCLQPVSSITPPDWDYKSIFNAKDLAPVFRGLCISPSAQNETCL